MNEEMRIGRMKEGGRREGRRKSGRRMGRDENVWDRWMGVVIFVNERKEENEKEWK